VVRDGLLELDLAWALLFSFGFEDLLALSHEMAETFNDPFISNATPWWESVDGFTGNGICGNILETGDVVEVLTTLPAYTVAMNGPPITCRTKHCSRGLLLSHLHPRICGLTASQTRRR
jgi:hypothetical protein